MNKLVIDPHYCSREDYKTLIDYLDENHWDYKIIEEPDNDPPHVEPIKVIVKGGMAYCDDQRVVIDDQDNINFEP